MSDEEVKLEQVLYERSPRILTRPKDHLGKIAWSWSTGLGFGILRPAPGTWGSLLAFGAFWVTSTFMTWGGGAGLSRFVSVIILLGVMAAGVIFGALLEERIHCGDHSSIVSDEVAGMILTLQPIIWLVPAKDQNQSFWLWAIGFVLFRLLDALKPFPINLLDRASKRLAKKGAHPLLISFAVQVDDWLAGLISAFALVYIIRLAF